MSQLPGSVFSGVDMSKVGFWETLRIRAVGHQPPLEIFLQCSRSACGDAPCRPLSQASPILAEKLQCNYTCHMSALHFEWDDEKATANVKKPSRFSVTNAPNLSATRITQKMKIGLFFWD